MTPRRIVTKLKLGNNDPPQSYQSVSAEGKRKPALRRAVVTGSSLRPMRSRGLVRQLVRQEML